MKPLAYAVEIWVDGDWIEVVVCHGAHLALDIVDEYRSEGHDARFIRRVAGPPEGPAADGQQGEEREDD